MFSLINKNKQRVKYFKKNSLRSVPVFLLKKILLPFLLLITITIILNGCNIINPQTGSLEGVVHRQSSESSEPLPDALISISGSTNTAYTDQEGYFLINEISAGKRTLTIIREGYITLKLINVFIEPNIINEVYFGEPIILQPKEDTILYDTAIEFLEQKDYQQAMDTFIELRDTFPDSSWADDAQYYIGHIYEISGLYIAARDEYSLLLFYYPDSSWADDARLGIGNCYYQTGDYYHAKIQYQSVIDNYPLSDLIPLAQYRIAWCNKRLGDNNEAIMSFQQIIALYPESIYAPAAQYFIGEIYYDLQNYTQAIIAFQTTINNYPFSTWPGENRLIAPAAYFYIGYCYEKQAMWEEAIAAYQVIIDEYPNSTWDDGKSIAAQAQQRIDFIMETYFPPEENPEEE